MAKGDEGQFAGRSIRTLPPELLSVIPSGRVPGIMGTYDQFPSVEPSSPISAPSTDFFTEVKGKLGRAAGRVGKAIESPRGQKAKDTLKKISKRPERNLPSIREFQQNPGFRSPEMDLTEITRLLRGMQQPY